MWWNLCMFSGPLRKINFIEAISFYFFWRGDWVLVELRRSVFHRWLYPELEAAVRRCSSKWKTPVLESKGKRQCWSPFLLKLQAWMKTYHFIKKRLQHRCFPMNIRKFLITSFFTEHLWWLLLQNLPYVNPALHNLLKW